MSRRNAMVQRLLFLLIAIVICLFAFIGTVYTAMTQEAVSQPLPRMVALDLETLTLTPTVTPTLTSTPAATLALTETPSPVPLSVGTPDATPTATQTETPEPTATSTTPETATATPSVASTETGTPEVSPTVTETPTVEPTPVATITDTVTPTVTETPTLVLTETAGITETVTLTVTETPTLTPTATEIISPSVEISPTVEVSATPTLTIPQLGEPIVRLNVVATPGVPPPAPTLVPSANDPHVRYTTLTSSCAGCHRTHTASGVDLRSAAIEESVCFACHRDTGASNPYPGTNVQPAFTSFGNTATSIFKHDVAATNGVHQAGESDIGQFGGANRHVECEDCHEPHKATRGAASPPFLQRVMNMVSGVDPTWTGAGSPSSYLFVSESQREYQVCFKCHSSYTNLPSYPPDGWDGGTYVGNGVSKLSSGNALQVADSRDLARMFNPYNASYHPVAAQGVNQNIPAGSWTIGSGMSQASLVYCSSCHGNPNSATQGAGPHGSPQLHILNSGANYSTWFVEGRVPNSQEICFQCHNYTTYAGQGSGVYTNFRNGQDNLHSLHVNSFGGTCYMCHNSHGSEQSFLINFDLTVVAPGPGLNSQTAYTAAVNGGSCSLTCHSKIHDPLTYVRQ